MKDWILYEDNHIIVVNKPPKIPVQGDRSGDLTLIDVEFIDNEAIEDGKKVKTFSIERMWGLGTPEDLNNFLRR